MRRRILELSLSLLVALTAGCRPSLEKPTPPDMSELVAAFASPTGTFDQTTADEVVAWVEGRLADLEDLGISVRIDELFGEVKGGVEGGEPETDTQSTVETDNGAVRIEGEGFVEITRICAGWGPEPVPDEAANGTLKLNVNITDLNVDSVVWASADRCHFLQEGVPILLEAGSRRDVGDLRIWVGDDVPIAELGQSPFIVDIDVTAGVDPDAGGATGPVDFEIRLVPETGGVEVRVPISSGDVFVMTTASDIIGVRAGNGEFTCDPVAATCQDDQGNVVTL